MFDFLKRKPDPAPPLSVWMTLAGRDAGVLARLKSPTARPLLIAHFPDTLAHWRNRLQAEGIAFLERWPAATDAPLLPVLLLGGALPNHCAPVGPLLWLEVEVHPSPLRAQRLFALRTALGQAVVKAERLTSLDEPFLSTFAGERTRAILLKLGMQEGDAIDHPMVANTVKRALEKLAKNAAEDNASPSAQEWLRRHPYQA